VSVPPIPQRLAQRPTKGGLVVPWIVGNVNGALFRGRIVRTRPVAQLLGGALT
jgi:hypothetical protein